MGIEKRNLNYLKAIVIVHGKSEGHICDFIKNKLRLNMHIERKHGGDNSIQITSVMSILKNTNYKTFDNFIERFQVEVLDAGNKKVKPKGNKKQSNKKRLADYFKIFIIMDTDDCSEEQKKAYIDKSMFNKHWAYEYIVPIYNITNLEDAMVDCGVPFEKKGDDRKKEYVKIFPIDKRYEKKDSIQLLEFHRMLEGSKKTNMDEFTKFCIEISEM